MENKEIKNQRTIRVLCRKLLITNKEPGLQWLIGSPFLPQFTILSTFRCLHTQPSTDPFSPNFTKESDDLQTLILRGFDIVGALVVKDQNWEENARIAVESACGIRKSLGRDDGGSNKGLIGAAADLISGEIRYFTSSKKDSNKLEAIETVVFENSPEKYVWERGCLIKCELEINLPFYFHVDEPSDSDEKFSRAVDAALNKLRDSEVVYMIEGAHEASAEAPRSVILRGVELDFQTDVSDVKLLKNASEVSDLKTLSCSYFCSKNRPAPSLTSRESADTIQVSVFVNRSEKSSKSSAPIAQYFPASEPAKLMVVSFKIEVLCYAAKDLPVAFAVSKLVVPGLGDQLTAMKKVFMPNLLTQHPQLHPYHFCPPGVLHPVTVIYELSYGETEMKQVQTRRFLHLRIGLPLDRPLLLVANALKFSTNKDVSGRSSTRNAALLKNVHTDVPSSGVSGGLVSRVDGSYEYYHYLQDGFNDSGWGCAYRSLQTIISWFRLQHYTSVEVPSHREIQQALVEIGDKDPSFIGSREWIGAIELSFVLDKLLGVSCKIINVRSGAELPEKCRELSMHFETQGTPVMIGGGVLAYTLLGIDYNETSSDCAFLILDPHYTGNDELKKIVNGGWCGWKKAIDSKGKSFFLHDKFYNLLLPQRPNMV